MVDRQALEIGEKGVACYSPILHYDMPDDFLSIFDAVRRYTMTTIERIYAVYTSTRYLVAAQVPGAFVECGVWRGGSIMTAILTLRQLGKIDRDIYLYDTFEGGMTPPTAVDTDHTGRFVGKKRKHFTPATLAEVQANVAQLGYPMTRVHFMPGRVEKLLPRHRPPRIAMLRLDTDWYVSTKHELESLYPVLAPGGVLIIDDYGYLAGARRAADEYAAEHKLCWLLNRIDSTGRLLVKNGR